MDMWAWSLRGESGRLISFTQSPYPDQSCLSFYYKIYGPNTGEGPSSTAHWSSESWEGLLKVLIPFWSDLLLQAF